MVTKDAPRRFDRLALELSQGLLRAVPTATNVGQAISTMRREAPLKLDSWWTKAQPLSDGPIDVIDMFSGCGGMSAGFRALNAVLPAFRHILALDIDSAANETYEQNLGLSPSCEDVHVLAEQPRRLERLLKESGRRPDAPLVLIGCAPCQGFSSHRNNAGATDARNGLFLDFAKIATRLRPDFVIVENVPELLTDHYWPVVAEARNVLEEAGYDVHLTVHNMAEFGVPQERFRALMLASRVPFTPLEGTVARDKFRTVRDAISHLQPIAAGEADSADPMHVTATHRESTLATIRAVPKNGGNRPFDVGPASLRTLYARQGKPAYEDVYGRLSWDKPAITITAYSRNPASGRFVHPTQDRGLSIREAASLQSFPASFQFSGSFDERFKQIGNAVPPLFATHLAISIVAQLAEPPKVRCGMGVQEPLGKSFSRLIPSLKAGSLRLVNATTEANQRSA